MLCLKLLNSHAAILLLCAIPATLKVKDRKKLFAAASDQEGILQRFQIADGIIAVLIESWSFEAPIPSILIGTLDELSMADYDVLTWKKLHLLRKSCSLISARRLSPRQAQAITENFNA
jgi:hypothetical protein